MTKTYETPSDPSIGHERTLGMAKEGIIPLANWHMHNSYNSSTRIVDITTSGLVLQITAEALFLEQETSNARGAIAKAMKDIDIQAWTR